MFDQWLPANLVIMHNVLPFQWHLHQPEINLTLPGKEREAVRRTETEIEWQRVPEWLKKIANYKRSLCCCKSWYLSPGEQSPSWVTQQEWMKQNKVAGWSVFRRVEHAHQAAHSFNVELHTEEVSPVLSCFLCICLSLSPTVTHTNTHTVKNTQAS